MAAPQLMTSARTGSGSDHWRTPPKVLELVRKVGPIALDPCWHEGCVVYPIAASTVEDDGLSHSWDPGQWKVGGLVYVNPPYSNLKAWMAKCAEEAANGCEIIALIPARTDTRAWHDYIWPTADAICFWKGRIKFWENGAPRHPAPFPSAVVYWGDNSDRFWEAFYEKGKIVLL